MNTALKNPFRIVALILLLAAVPALRLCRPVSSVKILHPHSAIKPEAEKASSIPPKPIPAGEVSAPDLPRPAVQQLVKRLGPTLQPWLVDRQGSYANLNDFLQSGESGFTLSSGWGVERLFPDRKFPIMELNFTRDPLTRQYQLSGGTLKLPWSGLEAGYERLPDNEEQKARIQWKKEF